MDRNTKSTYRYSAVRHALSACSCRGVVLPDSDGTRCSHCGGFLRGFRPLYGVAEGRSRLSRTDAVLIAIAALVFLAVMLSVGLDDPEFEHNLPTEPTHGEVR